MQTALEHIVITYVKLNFDSHSQKENSWEKKEHDKRKKHYSLYSDVMIILIF